MRLFQLSHAPRLLTATTSNPNGIKHIMQQQQRPGPTLPSPSNPPQSSQLNRDSSPSARPLHRLSPASLTCTHWLMLRCLRLVSPTSSARQWSVTVQALSPAPQPPTVHNILLYRLLPLSTPTSDSHLHP